MLSTNSTTVFNKIIFLSASWCTWSCPTRKICIGNHWGKKINRSYLSEEGRYRILTGSYGYKVTDRTGI